MFVNEVLAALEKWAQSVPPKRQLKDYTCVSSATCGYIEAQHDALDLIDSLREKLREGALNPSE